MANRESARKSGLVLDEVGIRKFFGFLDNRNLAHLISILARLLHDRTQA